MWHQTCLVLDWVSVALKHQYILEKECGVIIIGAFRVASRVASECRGLYWV
jgi:hypothetical protein